MPQRTVRIGDELWDRITAAAAREGMNASELIRQATIQWLATNDARQLLNDLVEETNRSVSELRSNVEAVDDRVNRIETALRRRTR